MTSKTEVTNSSGDLQISHLSDGNDLPLEEGLADSYYYYGKLVRLSMSRSGKIHIAQGKLNCFSGRAVLIILSQMLLLYNTR